MIRSLLLFLIFLGGFGVLGGNSVRIVSEDSRQIRLQVSIDDYTSEDVLIDGKKYSQITLQGEGSSSEPGYPQLPYISRSLVIPTGHRIHARVLQSSYENHIADIAPSKGVLSRSQHPDQIKYEFSNFYQSNDQYPEQAIELSEPFMLRDLMGITIYIHPFSYNPQAKSLRVYRSIEILLEFELEKRARSKEHSASYQSFPTLQNEFLGIYENLFINFDPVRYTQVSDQGRLLVISPSGFMSTIQPYVDWKRQKGIPTDLVNMSTIGTTATQLKTFVQNYYNQNPDLVFVQLVGDSEHIPSATYTWQSSTGASDPTLALVAGSDQYPDIFIGRFSCQSVADLETQIYRSIHYERDLEGNNAWLLNAMGIASNEGGGGQGDNNESDEQHMNVIRNNLLGYGYHTVDQIYESAGATASQISSALNSGRGLVNYVGHGLTDRWGTTSFNNNNVSSLNNQNKLPFIVSVACLNGNFTGVTCFGEAWTRARVANNPTGALAFYGSSVSQPWNPPMRAQDEIQRLLTNHLKNSVGGLFYNGSCRMIEVYGTTNGGVATFRTWHIFGDVSLQVRTKNPLAMNPVYNQSVSHSANSFTVNTGVPGALVALSYQNILYGSGYANSNGIASFSITLPNALAQMTLTITAFNRITHIGGVQIVPSSAPYLLVEDMIYSDNNNSTPEIGESGVFSVVLSNIGAVAASNIRLGISSSNPDVTFSSSIALCPLLSATSQVTLDNAFSFTLPSVAPNQSSIPFSILITADQGIWTSSMSQIINAPHVTLGSFIIDDVGGNNNRRLDPGEQVVVSKTILNTGNYPSSAGLVSLNSSSQYLGVSPQQLQIPSIPAGGQHVFTYQLSVAVNTPLSSVQVVTYQIGAAGYIVNGSDEFTVGLIIEDFESGGLAQFPWQSSGSQPWQITNSNVYSGVYCARSGLIGHNQSTSLQISMNVLENGNISFWRKVSSDLYYDKLNFYIDNTLQNSWHGEVSWNQQVFSVQAGLRTFKWEYTKDVAVSTGLDCAWIDDIIFPRSTPISNYNPPQALSAVQTGQSVALNWQAPILGIPSSYQVFRNDVFLLQTGAGVLNGTDANVSIGVSYIYKVKAIYSGGSSSFSNLAFITVLSPPQLDCDTQDVSRALSVESNFAIPILLGNVGGLNLNWTAQIEPTQGASGTRDMTGSWISCSPPSFNPGEVNTWTFTLKNMSMDGEFVSGATITLPAGFSVLSASAFSGGSSGDLVYTGSSSVLSWNTDDPSGWGVITPGEIATATVVVFVSPAVTGNQILGYGISGDEFGNPPHIINGQINLENLAGFWIALSSDSGMLSPQSTCLINLNINTHVVDAGIYDFNLKVLTNDPGLPMLQIPVKIRVYDNLDWFRVDNVSIAHDAQAIIVSWDPLWEADGYYLDYSEDGLEYELMETVTGASHCNIPFSALVHGSLQPNIANQARITVCTKAFFRIRAFMEER